MSQSIVNQKDRSVHFWKFFVLFLLSTGLIVAAVYFNYHLSDRETEMLRSEVKAFRIQEEAQSKFASTMEDAKKLIDSLSLPGVPVNFIDQQASDKIKQLSSTQYVDSSIYGALNRSIVNTLLQYEKYTLKVVNYGNAPKDLEELKLKYDQSQRDQEELKKNLDNCRALLNSNTGD
ncbi:MAG: hypothetical protein DI598_14100 [Pseudopedobacter saltans]|uniref:Type VI secretion system transmembrane protein TssO n=1 Tax=Pseudopedobacter saltans TaxID=151895 RepID=A0A2W5EQP6_9SPHI|nr:MAG: hypothetical protein DI598_14100 [Pseudopedobacter saltans]